MSSHTIHLKSGDKVTISGDKVEVHLASPLVFHRKKWIRWFSPAEETRRMMSFGPHESRVKEALEEAFRAVPMEIHPEDDDRPRHYDSNGYCDNPARGY